MKRRELPTKVYATFYYINFRRCIIYIYSSTNFVDGGQSLAASLHSNCAPITKLLRMERYVLGFLDYFIKKLHIFSVGHLKSTSTPSLNLLRLRFFFFFRRSLKKYLNISGIVSN